MAAVCRGKQRCRRCSKDHDGKECKEPVKCCNCGGDHLASFRGCQNYVKAENVERIKKENKISYAEAARRVEESRLGRQSAAVDFAPFEKGHAIAVNDDSVLTSKGYWHSWLKQCGGLNWWQRKNQMWREKLLLLQKGC